MMLFMLSETSSGSTVGKMSHFPLVSLKIKMLKARGMEKEEGQLLSSPQAWVWTWKGLFHTWKEPCFSGFIKLQGRGNVYFKAKMSTPCLT